MPKLAANEPDDELFSAIDDADAKEPTQVRFVLPLRTTDSRRSLTPAELAQAANHADMVMQSVTRRPSSDMAPTSTARPIAVPRAPRMPDFAEESAKQRTLLVYAIVAGAFVGVFAWFALRYL
jgi:hypothetical protein